MRCELALYLASQSATPILLLALRASRVALSEARAEAPTAAYCSCKSCCARADQGMSSQSRAIHVVLRLFQRPALETAFWRRVRNAVSRVVSSKKARPVRV